MKALLARYKRTLAMLVVFIVAMGIAHASRPAPEAAEGDAARLFGPSPATDIDVGAAPAETPEPSVPKPVARPAGSYEAVTVENGGTITGTVRLEKRGAPWTVERGKDEHACGASDATERMIVGADGRTLANCLVWLADISKGKAWTGSFAKGEDERTALLDQKGCVYVPHVLVVRTGTQIGLKNSDKAEHNIHAYYRDYTVTQINLMTAANSFTPESADAYIERAGKYLVKCDIHPWMSGYVHAMPHPYWALTAEDGAFRIENVPPGTYALVCWHEGMQEKPIVGAGGIAGYDYGPDFETSVQITVEAGGTATHDFTVPNPR